MRKSTLLITLGLCLISCQALFPIAAYIGTYFIPRKYTSFVNIEVKSNTRNTNSLGEGENLSSYANPHFVADQIQILQSKEILVPVIEELELIDKWSVGRSAKLTKDETYSRLLKMTEVSQQRGTDILFVAVTSADRMEAADIANTIAVIYLKKRRDDLQAQITTALQELNAQVEKQRQILEAAKAELDRIQFRDKVQDPNPDKADAPAVTQPDSEYEAAKKKYLDAKKLLDAAQQEYETERMQLHIEMVPVKIWDRAEPALGPSSPNTILYLEVATGLGFLSALGGIGLLVLGLRLKREEAAPSSLPSGQFRH